MTELRPLAPGRLLVGGCPEGFDARYLAETIARAGGPVIHVARDDARLAALRASLRFFAPELPVLTLPGLGLPALRPHLAQRRDRRPPHGDAGRARRRLRPPRRDPDHGQRRHPARARPRRSLRGGELHRRGRPAASTSRRCAATSPAWASSRRPPSPSPASSPSAAGSSTSSRPAPAGRSASTSSATCWKAPAASTPRPSAPPRRSKRVELAPVSEVILDEPAIQRFRTRYREHVRRRRPRRPALRGDQRRAQAPGLRALAALLPRRGWRPSSTTCPARRCSSTTRPPPPAPRAGPRSPSSTTPAPQALAAKSQARHRLQAGAAGRALPRRRRLGRRALAARPLHQLSALPQPLGPGVIDAGGRIGRDFAPERQQESLSLFGALAAHVAARRRKGDVVIASYSAGARERLAGLLADSGVTDAREIATRRRPRAATAASASRSGRSSTASRPPASPSSPSRTCSATA